MQDVSPDLLICPLATHFICVREMKLPELSRNRLQGTNIDFHRNISQVYKRNRATEK